MFDDSEKIQNQKSTFQKKAVPKVFLLLKQPSDIYHSTILKLSGSSPLFPSEAIDFASVCVKFPEISHFPPVITERTIGAARI